MLVVLLLQRGLSELEPASIFYAMSLAAHSPGLQVAAADRITNHLAVSFQLALMRTCNSRILT